MAEDTFLERLGNLGVVLLAGMGALRGFVLITWTASYLYLEMTRMWRTKP